MNKRRFSLIAAIIATINVSFAAIFIKLSVSSFLIIAFYRLLFSTILLLPLIMIKDNLRELKLLIKKEIKFIIIIGVALGLHFGLWTLSLEYTSVGNSVFLVNMAPILVAIFSRIFLNERLKWVQWVGVIISITGSFIITFWDLTSSFSWIGSILALFGALFLAVYLVGGRKLRIKYGVIPYVFLVYLTATISLLIINLLYQGSLLIISVYDFIYIILLALISTIFGHTLYNFALGKISASVISIILLGEPVISTLLAIIILSEIPTVELLIGGILILVGIFLTIKKLGKKEITKSNII